MGSLLDMLAIAARGDVRSDVLKELERHLTKLHEYQNHPGIDARAPARADEQSDPAAHRSVRGRAPPGCSRCGTRSSWRPSSIAARSRAAPANSICPTITSGSISPTRCAWPRSCAGRACCGRCAMRSPSCCGSRARTAVDLARRSPRAACSTSTSIARRPTSCCASTVPAGAALYPEISGSHYRCSMRFLEWTGHRQPPEANRHGRALHTHLLPLNRRPCACAHLPDLQARDPVERAIFRGGRSAASAARWWTWAPGWPMTGRSPAERRRARQAEANPEADPPA